MGGSMEKSCYRCGKELTSDKSILISGKEITVCQECAEEAYEQCPSCKKYACSQDFFYVDDDSLCIWCVSEKAILCPQCCNFFPEDKVSKIHGYFVCHRCLKEYFQECQICHKSFEEDEFEDVLIDGNYEKICLNCWKEKYFRCDCCHCTYPKQESCSYQGKEFCEDCFRSTVADDILDGKLAISALQFQNKKESGRTASVSSSIFSEDPEACFYEDGYRDDYLSDGLDGNDDYLGDGLDE